MFLLSFLFYIFLFTSFLQFKRGLVFFIFFEVVLFVALLISSKRKSDFYPRFKKYLWQHIVAFGLAFLAIIVSLFSYQKELFHQFWDFYPLSIENASGSMVLLDNVLILEQTKSDTYLIQDQSGSRYFLKSQKDYADQDSLSLGAFLKPVQQKNLYLQEAFATGFSFSKLFTYQFNYDKWLLMKGVSGTLYEKNSLFSTVDQKRSVFAQWRFQVRSRLKEHIQNGFSEKEAGLLLGMLIGDKSTLPTAEYQNFVKSGIVHIIAVSGGNLVMIVVFLGMVLFFLPFYVRNAVIILGVVGVSDFFGGDSSVIRALIMAILSLVALFWGREINIWRLLKYSVILMLCYNPFFLLYDLGFLLSFGAVIGISLVTQSFDFWCQSKASRSGMRPKKYVKTLENGFKNYVLPTFGATLGTFPVLLFFIGETNLTGVLVNILIIPLVPLITIGGFLGLLLVSWSSWSRLLLPIKRLLSLVYFLSDWAITHALSIQVHVVRIKWVLLLLFLVLGVVIFRLLRSSVIHSK